MNKNKILSVNDLFSIFSSSRIAMAVYTGKSLLIETATDAMLALWGKERSVIGLPLSEVVPELAGKRFIEDLDKIWQTGKDGTSPNILAQFFVHGKVQVAYYNHQYQALRNGEGQIYGLLHIATPVTESSLDFSATEKLIIEQPLNTELAAANRQPPVINEKLDNSRQNLSKYSEKLEDRISQQIHAAKTAAFRLEAMVMNTPVAMTILKGNELIVEIVNRPMLEVWRRTREQVIGRGLVEIFPELSGQPNPGRMRGVMESGKRFTLPETEVFLGTVDGVLKKHYASFSYDPIIEKDGTIDSILVTVINITDEVTNRQQLEHSRQELLAITEELAEANLRLNMAMEASALGIAEVIFDTDEMISNVQFKKNFGKGPEEKFTYSQLFEAMLPEYREVVRRKVDTAIIDRTIYEAEYEIQWSDGSRHWISAHGIPRYENGVANRIVGVSRLITQQKNMEQQKDDFLSVASHELKTPVTALKGNLQLLQRLKNNIDNPMVPKLIDSASKGITKINILIDDLLDMSRFSHSKLSLQFNSFNVMEVVKNSTTTVLAENNYTVEINGDSKLIVNADEHRIEQVIVNFMTNAVKYAPESKVIKVDFECFEEVVKIAVTDHGPGIPSDQLPYLFNRYWQANQKGNRYMGLGLGLFICAEIIERHGGKIGAESTIGKGSTFWFTIPLK